jgi:hypothetical protein
MFCPMKYSESIDKDGGILMPDGQCEKECCAWWYQRACAIQRIATSLDVMAANSAAQVRRI